VFFEHQLLQCSQEHLVSVHHAVFRRIMRRITPLQKKKEKKEEGAGYLGG